MDIIIFEDSIKYDRWLRLVLWLPVVLLGGLGFLFLLNYYGYDIFGRGPVKEAGEAAAIFLGSALFVIILFQIMFPRALAVTQDGIIIRFRYFTWKIPFEKILYIELARGLARIRTFNLSLSFKGTVEICWRNGTRIRITPAHPYELLAQATRAFEEWKRYHPADSQISEFKG